MSAMQEFVIPGVTLVTVISGALYIGRVEGRTTTRVDYLERDQQRIGHEVKELNDRAIACDTRTDDTERRMARLEARAELTVSKETLSEALRPTGHRMGNVEQTAKYVRELVLVLFAKVMEKPAPDLKL